MTGFLSRERHSYDVISVFCIFRQFHKTKQNEDFRLYLLASVKVLFLIKSLFLPFAGRKLCRTEGRNEI